MFGRRPGGFLPSSNLGLEIGGRDYGPPPPFLDQISKALQPKKDPTRSPEVAVAYSIASAALQRKAALIKHATDAAKAKAISDFKKRFPNADMSKFKTEVSFKGHIATADVLFIEGPDSWADISLIDRKDWTEPRKAALGLYHSGGFPYQLT